VGQWVGPYDISVSCDATGSSGPPCNGTTSIPPNGSLCSIRNDEVAHAALIPSGQWAGMVLVWTVCDQENQRGDDGYYAHVWDPKDPFNQTIDPPTDILAGLPNRTDGPFCSGHCWGLDEQKDAKLFVAGGKRPGQPTRGLNAAFWFDPNVTSGHWVALPSPGVELYYPTVAIVYDPVTMTFFPVILGGSGLVTTENNPGGCGFDAGKNGWWTYEMHWSLTRPYLTSSWATHASTGYGWQQYPRPFLLSNGHLVTVGNVITCEKPLANHTLYANTEYGDNPVNDITITSATSQVRAPGPDPNTATPTSFPVGGWNYNSAALLHTLDKQDLLLSIGGTQELYEGTPFVSTNTDAYNGPANTELLELLNGAWVARPSPSEARTFGSFVLLPDRTVLLVGGQSRGFASPLTTIRAEYRSTTERYDPIAKTWKQMAGRLIDATEGVAIPRGYHSVALLQQNGSVALMGGSKAPSTYPESSLDPSDTVEVYQPPYFSESGRLKITGLSSGTMMYGDATFCITVNNPAKVSHAVLMGVPSVTHAFDYGQRYVELQTSTSGCSDPYNLSVLPPTSPTLVPEGYYLLFVVEDRGGTLVPCIKGKFVRVY